MLSLPKAVSEESPWSESQKQTRTHRDAGFLLCQSVNEALFWFPYWQAVSESGDLVVYLRPQAKCCFLLFHCCGPKIVLCRYVTQKLLSFLLMSPNEVNSFAAFMVRTHWWFRTLCNTSFSFSGKLTQDTLCYWKPLEFISCVLRGTCTLSVSHEPKQSLNCGESSLF